jgi:hypothetical protein
VRMMMKLKLDTEAGSRAISDGSMAGLMQETLGTLRPEAAYFGPEDGVRTAFIVFDMQDPSQLPSLTEPLFRKPEGDHRDVPSHEPGGSAEGTSAARHVGAVP